MEELRRHVARVAGRLLNCPEEAEDVTQEAFLRLVKAQSNGAAVRDERAFVTTTAVRLAIDRLRKASTRRAKLRDVARNRPQEEAEPELPGDVSELYKAINALPPKQAAVITLRELMELPYSDVALLLGISIESCRTHCRLAKQRLRKALAT